MPGIAVHREPRNKGDEVVRVIRPEEEAVEIGHCYRAYPHPNTTLRRTLSEEIRSPDAVATGRRHLLYGVRRYLWH